MKRLDLLCNEMGQDLRLKLSANAQCSLSGQTIVFGTETFNIDTKSSIIRNGVLNSDKKIQLINAMDTLKAKRAILRQEKKNTGILWDKISASEQLFENCLDNEQNFLDANIEHTFKEKAYRMFYIQMVVTEMEQDKPKKVQYVLKSIQCTKTGRSVPKTYAIAEVERNYVQISDFIVLKDNEDGKVYEMLTLLFNKYALLKKECENWQDISEKIQSNLNEVENSDYKTVMYWIEKNII